ncbi:MAG: type IV pili methyl-accepting chemotaxis transducer N-terminal domain-containing protein [Burkholderiales bacterium]
MTPEPLKTRLTALVVAPPVPDAPDLVADLETAGAEVIERCLCAEMVRSAVRHAPDVIVCWFPQAGELFFDAVRLLNQAAPTAVLVFTSDLRVEVMERSLDCGIASWVVNGYAPNRLRPLLQLTCARFVRERKLRADLEELSQRLEERKLVDRAKGILMTARQVSEDEAFRLLRSASMQAKRRIGQVSQQVIAAAHYGEAVNRAGRLRFLSQRVVKLYALAMAGVDESGSRALLAASVAQIQDVLANLIKTLSQPTFGDLIVSAQQAWSDLHERLESGLAVGPGNALAVLSSLDEAAERLLTRAEQLTMVLEDAGLAPTLHVINIAARQRMLSQRLAKFALLTAAMPAGLPAFAPEVASTAEAFERSLAYLRDIPLSTAATREALAAAEAAWQRMLDGARHAREGTGRQEVAVASEELLVLFDSLTSEYERSMQVLIG